MLKERARLMGINFSGNIGMDTLRSKIQDRLDGMDAPNEPEAATASANILSTRAKTQQQIEQEIRDTMQVEQMALVRCRIYNLNPSKRDLTGEIITVANRYLGTVRLMTAIGGTHLYLYIAHRLSKSRVPRHLPSRKVSPDPAAAGFFRCIQGLCGRGC